MAKVKLKVSVSEADYGTAGVPGDVIEVPDEAVDGMVAAGIAEPAGRSKATGTDDEAPTEARDDPEPPDTERRVPRRGGR